eukprot:TRINITY_DN3397_c0_g1_i1.p2 TRINITY_DN3397_c0_g1~~TRINITY_DN3397_c0_g1_i1.p2  ORF type:complete len:76 (+),score=19.44 TRINITY_DN3397_c0_g1_i1:304-531(+)
MTPTSSSVPRFQAKPRTTRSEYVSWTEPAWYNCIGHTHEMQAESAAIALCIRFLYEIYFNDTYPPYSALIPLLRV